jgi:hypothetical protein
MTYDQKSQYVSSELVAADYTITAYTPGYDTVSTTITLKDPKDTLIVLEMTSSLTELPRLRVIPDETIHNVFVPVSSEFKSKDLLNTAGSGDDINRILVMHPAASSMNLPDNNGLNIRGGSIFENLYYIDGIEFYTINHFATERTSGALGFIAADLVNKIRINTVMQPYLPPRNSSVIEIDIKDAPERIFSCQLDLNISGISLQLQGTSNSRRPSYLANFRWMDLKPLERFTNGVWSQFGDVVLKGTYVLNDYHTIGSTSLISYDKSRSKTTWSEDHPNAIYQKELLQINCGVFSKLRKERVYNRFTLSCSFTNDEDFQKDSIYNLKYDSIYGYVDQAFLVKLFDNHNQKRHILLNNFLALDFTNNIVLETGVRVKATDYTGIRSADHYYWQYYYDESFPIMYETGGYVIGQFQRNKIKIITGARCDYYSFIKAFGIAPYLGISYVMEKEGAIKLQTAYSYQEPPQLLPRYAWLYIKGYKIDEFVLQRCWQSSLLYEKTIRTKHAFTAESFFKYYTQEYPYYEPYRIRISDNILTVDGKIQKLKIADADGKKYVTGLELSLHNVKKMFLRYRFGLTLAKSKNRFTNRRWYSDDNDIRLSLKLALGRKLNKNHNISFTCLALEGRPYSNTNSISEPSSLWFIRRYDPTIYLSTRYSFTYSGKRVKFGAYIDVQNILNQTHVVATQEVDNERVEREMVGILPTAGITAEF